MYRGHIYFLNNNICFINISYIYASQHYFHASMCSVVFCQRTIIEYSVRRHCKWHKQINTCNIHNEHNPAEEKAI